MAIVIINQLSWHDTLYPHAHIGHVDRMREFATILGYRFFAWNGLVYKTETGECTNLRVGSVI
jgi:hypothetical protein